MKSCLDASNRDLLIRRRPHRLFRGGSASELRLNRAFHNGLNYSKKALEKVSEFGLCVPKQERPKLDNYLHSPDIMRPKCFS